MKTQLGFGLAALVVLTGCAQRATVSIQSTENESYLREKAEYEPNIGKAYWTKTLVFLCGAPDKLGANCDPIVNGTKLQADGLEQGKYGMPYYHVTLSDGRAGYVMAVELKVGTTDIDPAIAAAECKRRGEPRVGMSAKQLVATCWGKPDRVDRKETTRGVTDRYAYSNGRVILHNGIVTSVQTSGTLR